MNTELTTVLKNEGISLIGGRIAFSIKDHFRKPVAEGGKGLKGVELRKEYYRITDLLRHDVDMAEAEGTRLGFKKEIVGFRNAKDGTLMEFRTRYFRPLAPKVKGENAKDKEIAELKAKLAAMEAPKA